MAEHKPSCEPFWHVVISDEAPSLNKAIKRADIAQEYADRIIEAWPDVRVVGLYTAAQLAAEVAAAVAKERERYHALVDWLNDQSLLNVERCQIDKPETLGDWWVLRRPYLVGEPVSYGKTEDEAIAAAIRTDAEGQHG